MNNHSERQLRAIQDEYREKISLHNTFEKQQLALVAGVDIAYWTNEETDYGVCCIQVLDYQTKKVVEAVEYVGEVTFPYIPGYLAFRELPLIKEAIKKLTSAPDLYMFDGNGYLHHRNMGIATHASFELEKPTIGVAKTYFKVGNVDFTMPENKKGAYTDIIVDGTIYGRALRTRVDVKPVFLSCGNWIDLDTATEITMYLVEKDSRLPVTTRYADLATYEARRMYNNNSEGK
ncbi:endonuclease V [Priestia koreensis]|uniref:endonuclease V n=1 Tax=Priestia koreensis TaxID=284581 RepID=UPI00203D4669|nr:endonuclease V [Priestia koreensis]MCM3003624.1 endonuclease V [Priestia koreensis]